MDAESIRELFVEFGPVDVRRMFGGAGVFVDGRMIALVSRELIYLKADAETIPTFEQEGLTPFGYSTKDGVRKLTSYWRMPDRLYDDPEELARWARAAHAAALRATNRKAEPALRRPATHKKRKFRR
jgi:DNA transformation protein